MSKIAEKKALEAYPPHYQKLAGDGYFDMSLEKREGYIQGYDQALQDFLEKACKWLKDNIPSSDLEHKVYNCFSKEQKSNLIKRFKNYMQNE